MSPRKPGPAPNTPSRQLRVAPRGKDSPAGRIKEGGAQVTQEVLPAVKNRKTQVMLTKPIKEHRFVENQKRAWPAGPRWASCSPLNSPLCPGAPGARPRAAVSQ